jgi:chaperone required for assembly of F1-ATPase
VKRFWDTASVAQVDGAYRVLLDGRPMRLPGGVALSVSSAPLARALAAEWQAAGGAKGGEMSFADTPLTRLAGTAQERIATNMEASVDALATYGRSDLLCYRAERPQALVARQAREWQPWLDWAARELDAALLVTSGITHVPQPQTALRALHRAVARYDANVLAGLGIAVPALGSLVLGLALAGGHLDGAVAHALGTLDELFQEEAWGVDQEAAARRANVGADIILAARFMALAQAQGAA